MRWPSHRRTEAADGGANIAQPCAAQKLLYVDAIAPAHPQNAAEAPTVGYISVGYYYLRMTQISHTLPRSQNDHLDVSIVFHIIRSPKDALDIFIVVSHCCKL